jgi:ethanolamine ammonia-lyase large subunit
MNIEKVIDQLVEGLLPTDISLGAAGKYGASITRSANGNNGRQREFVLRREARPAWLASDTPTITASVTGEVTAIVHPAEFIYLSKKVRAKPSLAGILNAIGTCIDEIKGSSSRADLEALGYVKQNW